MVSGLPLFFLLALLVMGMLLVHWWSESRRHGARLRAVHIRVHVNGIRGKSTVTRLVAGVLREYGLQAVAKTTGTLAAVIDCQGHETKIQRRGAATILEQVEVVEQSIPFGTDAMVVECMALKPAYQEISESKIICSTIGILTNVRIDHQDVMGETLPEIARALLHTCPRSGVLITAEQAPDIQAIIREVAAERGSRVIIADPAAVHDHDLIGFDYVAFKDNLAIGFAIASLLGIPRATAMAGMLKAPPDPGVLRFQHYVIGKKRVTWANLFASNDTESVIAAMKIILGHRTSETTMVGILNNRADREVRCLQFADIASLNVAFDRVATFGAYESVVSDRMLRNGYPAAHIIPLGEQRDPSLDEILDQLVHRMPTPHVLLVGLANIHTKQAELLLEHLEHLSEERDAAPSPVEARV